MTQPTTKSTSYSTTRTILLVVVLPLILAAVLTRPLPAALRRLGAYLPITTASSSSIKHSMSTSTSTSASNPSSDLKFTPRKSEERGGANHGWLKTFHTFSFANYQDDGFDQYGPLRVINEGESCSLENDGRGR